MEQAGLAAAQLLHAVHPFARRIDVMCGPGNNGGDGLAMARRLHALGKQVQVHVWGSPSLQPDRAMALARAIEAGVPVSAHTEPAATSDCVVDALLGIGLRGRPRGAVQQGLTHLHQVTAPILALDTPSGLDTDTGKDHGAARCRWTLTFLAPKPGLFTGDGRDRCGELWLADLGALAPAPGRARLLGSHDLAQWRRHSPRCSAPYGGHKGRQGDAWIVGGTPSMAGAARLAARAALAAGAGRVYLVADAGDPLQPELLLRQRVPPGQTVVAGCGGGPDFAQLLPLLLAEAGPLVLDAEALIARSLDPQWHTQLQSRQGQATVLTPHPLEAARLLQCEVADVQADRLVSAQRLAERARCTVVLKGSGTVIAHPNRAPWINTTGHAALGTAGTGDVLAGWLGGLMAQAPLAPTDELAGWAVAWHGAAADDLPAGGGPLLATELIACMASHHPRPT